MKATGIVRKVDELGRLVIPKEIRDTNRIDTGTPMEFLTDEDGAIIVRKYQVGGACIECGSFQDGNKSTELVGKRVRICRSCAEKLSIS